MSTVGLGQIYWNLLHAEHGLGEFSSDIFMLDGVDTKRYNALFVGSSHRIMNAKEFLKRHISKEEIARLDAEFSASVKPVKA